MKSVLLSCVSFSAVLLSGVLLSSALLAGCSTTHKYKDVTEGANGVHSVLIRTDNVEAASKTAVDEANQYCRAVHNSEALFVRDADPSGEKKDFDSATRANNNAKTVGTDVNTSDVPTATSLAGFGAVGGATGGVPADQALSKTFSVQMRFTCR